MSKKTWAREAWEAAIAIARQDEGLPAVQTKGMWTAEKLYFLCGYLSMIIEAFPKGGRFPNGVGFIDCFAGSGACDVWDQDDRLHRYPGSSLIAASIRRGEKGFAHLLCVEENARSLDALKSRIAKSGYSGTLKTWNGDFNCLTEEVAKSIPPNALNIAFVDPYSLDAHFSSIRAIANARPLDLIILFSDRIDLQRNVNDVYYPGTNPKLDLFLGQGSNWRTKYDQLQNRDGDRLRQLFADMYGNQLQRIGYKYWKSWPLHGPRGAMFRLFFASKHQLGLKFCDIALKDKLGETNKGLFG